ncbi:hypothetical protein [Modestobacter sp. DSM 44400]|uniref:hypothetical protein n=1 Tax=Modestobacter sp. DSM 44400 TaxID=1550230 RepID=UPI000B8227C6|nr:hypothetical protein [Modestobacter sp. DSM 44400]
MAETSELSVLTLPPIPLASGQLVFARGKDRPQRLSRVELVLTTELGEEVRMPLVEQHGAWWAPTSRLARA